MGLYLVHMLVLCETGPVGLIGATEMDMPRCRNVRCSHGWRFTVCHLPPQSSPEIGEPQI